MNKFKLQNSCSTRYNPSVVEYSAKLNAFIVGTYSLIESDSSKRQKYNEQDLAFQNNRVGSLDLYRSEENSLKSLDTEFGGVFDLRISSFKDKESNENETIIVAYANGYLAVHSLSWNCLSTIVKYKTDSTMLCTVDEIVSLDGLAILLAGSSDGLLMWYPFVEVDSNESVSSSHRISSKLNDPIWYLKVVPLPKLLCHLIFVGSEDSKWRIFSYKLVICFFDGFTKFSCFYLV